MNVKMIPPEPPEPEVVITLTKAEAQQLAALLFVVEGLTGNSLYATLCRAGIDYDSAAYTHVVAQRRVFSSTVALIPAIGGPR